MEKLKCASEVLMRQFRAQIAFREQNPRLDVQDVGLEPFLQGGFLLIALCLLHVLVQLSDAVNVLFDVAILLVSIRDGDTDGVFERGASSSGRDLVEKAWARGLEILALLLLAR